MDNPWLTICNTAPDMPSDVKAKMPSTMKPRWATEE